MTTWATGLSNIQDIQETKNEGINQTYPHGGAIFEHFYQYNSKKMTFSVKAKHVADFLSIKSESRDVDG